MDTGLYSLLTLAAFHGIAADEALLRREYGKENFDTQSLLLAGKVIKVGKRQYFKFS